MNTTAAAVLLFSGGRDSSLAACLLARQGRKVHLVTCDNGASIGPHVTAYRYEELKTALGTALASWRTVPCHGLFRRLAIADIENDFAKYKNNLILLGAQLAAITEGIRICQLDNIYVLATGFSGYQSHYAEQMPEAISAFRNFTSTYGITFETPIAAYSASDDVKYALLDFGVSTKSLESVSLFADSFSIPNPDTVTDYIQAKLPICTEYLSFKLCNSVTST